MKNHFRVQPKINAVSALILLSYVGLSICCLRTSAKPETQTTQKKVTLLANHNIGAYNLENDSTRERMQPAGETAINAALGQLAAHTSLVWPDRWEQIPLLQNTLRVAVLPEPRKTESTLLGGEMRKSTSLPSRLDFRGPQNLSQTGCIVEINGKILLENRQHNHKLQPLANR